MSTVTWRQLAAEVKRLILLHNAAYGPRSGLKNFHVAVWDPPEVVDNILEDASAWCAEHVPAPLRELLQAIDWHKAWVLIYDLPGLKLAATWNTADQPVGVGLDSLGTFVLMGDSPYNGAFGLPAGRRHFAHRLAACCQLLDVCSFKEPWYPRWGKHGGEGQPMLIDFDANGKPVETPWEE